MTQDEYDEVVVLKKEAARWQAMCKGMLADDQHMLQFLDDRMPAKGCSIEHVNIAMDLWIEEQKQS